MLIARVSGAKVAGQRISAVVLSRSATARCFQRHEISLRWPLCEEAAEPNISGSARIAAAG